MYSSYEDELQLLIDKVENVSDKDWEDLVCELDVRMHPDSLRKSFNVGRYSGYQVAKYYQEKFENEYCAQEEIDRLENLKNEVYKEKVKFQDARREYRKYLSNEARYENLVDILKKEISNMDALPYYEMGERVKKDLPPKSAVLMCSDWHIGALVDTQWNYYSIDIAKDRVGQLVDKVKKYALSYNITDLMVEINGDMINGIINTSNRVQSEEDAVSQTWIAAEIIANMINALKPYFKSIKVVTTLGNHGRLIPDKRAAIGKENMELLVPEILRLRLGEDIGVLSSQGLDFMKYEFAGRVICLAHGQHDKVNKVIEDFSKVYKVVPDEIHLGHTHSYKDINSSNIYITVNGSLMGADEYALGLREVTKPSQNLIIYGEDRGVFELILDK